MKKILTMMVLLFGLSVNAYSQGQSTNGDLNINAVNLDQSKHEIKGDKYYFVYSFDKAIECYNRASELTVEGQRRLAKSYHNLSQNTEAEAAYANLVVTPGGNMPNDYFNYAMVLKTNGKYAQSNIWMDKFKDMRPGDLRAINYVENKDLFGSLSRDEGNYKIVHMDDNSGAQDFGSSYYQDKVVFVSSRATNKINERRYNWNGQPFYDIYVAEIVDNQLKSTEIFDKSFKGKLHDGPVSFSKNGTYMAYTRNNYSADKKDKVIKLQIYFSNLVDGKWSEPESFSLNNSEYSVGHPSLTADGKTMYFCSDKPGGYGGPDIYKISKDVNGKWGKSENLGNAINTEGDEMFPFFEENNSVLFFASNGRFGLGGMDIFIASVDGPKIGQVNNVGFPLNSQYDDFAVIVDGDMSKGYFSSNRSDGKGGDDIYFLDILKDFDRGNKIEGVAVDKNGYALPYAFITLEDDAGDVIDTFSTSNDGSFDFFVDSDKNWKLIGEKESYLDGNTFVNTFGETFIVKADIVLLMKEKAVVVTPVPPVKPQEGNVVVAPVAAESGFLGNLETEIVYFDLDKYNIRPDAVAVLDKVVKIMNEYPEMIVELSAYTDCRESNSYNQRLSDKRAKASLDYVKKRITKPSRVYGKGYSESRLVNGCACEGVVVSGCMESEHQKNRRTEFMIVKK